MPPPFDELAKDAIHHANLLVLELGDVLETLVRPTFDDDFRSRYPRTLYGFLMNAMAFTDLLSLYDEGAPYGRPQTPRMERFLVAHFDCSTEAAKLAVKMYRHTLMHGANPRVLQRDQAQVSWLLHWGEPWMPAEFNLTVHHDGPLAVVQISVQALIEGIRDAAERLFQSWAADPDARVRVEAAEASVTTW